MQVHFRVAMWVVLAVVALVSSVSEGRVLDRCQLENELNQTLPANLSDRITEIVCRVENTSLFDTRTIKQIVPPRSRDKRSPRPGVEPIKLPHPPPPSPNPSVSSPPPKNVQGGDHPTPSPSPSILKPKPEYRRSRSPKGKPDEKKSSGIPKPSHNSFQPHNESHEDDHEMPVPSFNTSVVNKTAHHADDNHDRGSGGRKPRAARSKAEKLKVTPNSSKPHNESQEHDLKPPYPGFNTSAVNQTASHEHDDHGSGHKDDGHGPGGRKPRAARSKAEKPKVTPNSSKPHNESQEHDLKPPYPGFNTSAVNQTASHEHDDHGSGHKDDGPGGRKPRAARSKAEKPKVTPNSSKPHNESQEHDSKPPSPVFNTSAVNQTAPHKDDGDHAPGGRRSRSLKRKPEEHKPSATPKPHLNSSHPHNESQEHHLKHLNTSVVNQTTHHKEDDHSHGHKARSYRSSHDASSEEVGKHDHEVWTLYGLFQLADRVACVSGTKPSLNLCGLTCDKLIDDDITDDIACVGVIIDKMTSLGKARGESAELIRRMYDLLHQRECSGLVASQYFSAC